VSWRVICDPYGHELEKPEVAPSGFMQELPQASGSSTRYLPFIAPSGCLQGRRHAQIVTHFYSMSMVRFPFLYLQKLF
jgi:hypothetical protein